jgi:AcrR family transcriptional regulator
MDETKRSILTAGRTLLIRDGAGGFSMRKVAIAAGISLGNLQYHYKTKDDLLEGMLDWFLIEYTRELELLEPTENRGPGSLTALVREILEDESDEAEIPFLRALLILSDERRLMKKLEEYFSGMYDVFRRGLARVGGIDADSPAAHKAASLLMPFVQGYGLVRPSLDCDIACVSQMLSEQLWTLLTQERPQ